MTDERRGRPVWVDELIQEIGGSEQRISDTIDIKLAPMKVSLAVLETHVGELKKRQDDSDDTVKGLANESRERKAVLVAAAKTGSVIIFMSAVIKFAWEWMKHK